MNSVFSKKNFKLLIAVSNCISCSSLCLRWATTSGSAASVMMKNIGDKKTRNQRVRLHKNRRKNLTRAEKLNPATTDWSSIFTVAQSFNPAVVPLPIRMGRPRPNKVGDIPPIAQGNIELLKIPNFFHLTPPAIQKHCNALRELCLPWPENLKEKPIRIVTNNYLYAGPSVRHPESRIVKLQVYLKDLELDDHARKKLIILAGPDRYCLNTDELTIVADSCPTRKQNKEYAMYLLTALYQESWKTEDWEKDIPEDMSILDLMEEVSEALKQQKKNTKKKTKTGNVTRVVGDKLVRFNRYGKAFIIENSKYGIFGPPTKDELNDIEQEWQKIKPY